MPRSKEEKALYMTKWRRNSYKEKRFNKPLREYMELKYRDNYNQFCHFFKHLDKKHPTAKDLTRTSTFKEWKRRQLNCESSDNDETPETEQHPDETTDETPETEQHPDETSDETPETEQHPDETSDETPETEPEIRPVEQPDILATAMHETLPPDDVDNITIEDVNNIIEQIINEFEQDAAVRDLLNVDELVHPHYEDEDEGIELNVEAELQDIIEPFDYSEVEGFDF